MARDAIEQIELTLRLVESYPETFQLVSEPDEVKKIYAEGRIACSIGIEGLHMAGNSIGIIRAFYRLGVRYVSLSTNMKSESFSRGIDLMACYSALSLISVTTPLRTVQLPRLVQSMEGFPNSVDPQ